jgi:hypothetical protein
MEREIVVERRMGASGTAVLALFVAIIALVLAILAYNRTGVRLDNQIEARFKDYSQEVNLVNARNNAANELENVRTRIAAGGSANETASTVARIKLTTQNAFQNARNASSSEWQELGAIFDRLGGEIRNRSANARATLDELIGNLRTRYDTNAR